MLTDGIREFVAVVEGGGFTAAANALDVSTSFVSRQVKRLEDRLETRLLNRTTRAVSLTDIGRSFYERSREIIDQFDALESDLADLQKQPKGHIRMTAPGFYAENYVAPALIDFAVMYPDVTVDLDTRMHIVDLVNEGLDLAVRMSAPADSSLVARKVAARRLIVCASPDYLSRRGTPATPEELRRHNCLNLPDLQWRFAYPDAVRSIRVRGSFRSDNGRTLVAAAVRGIGIVRITDYYVRNEIYRGDLVPVLERYEVSDAATWVVYPDRHHLPARVRLLIEFLADRLREPKT